MEVLTALAALSLAVWLYLIFLHGGFWRADQRFAPATAPAFGGPWPAVAVVVPARNEATVIGRAIAALLAQDYPGRLKVVVVDDRSDDGTAEVARAAARDDRRFHMLCAEPLPAGWAGKPWALSQGVARVAEALPEARYLMFSDGDIEHDPEVIRGLVAMAEAEGLGLVSLMAWLRCESPWERLLIPAFVFFFQKLYPFPWVNDRRRRMAAAAGGCVLVRRDALDGAGGIAAIRGALIDDCALARAIKPGNAIWLGLTTTSHSLRPNTGLGDIWTMVARTAYTQLRHSPWLLAGTVAAMAVVYVAPPLAAMVGAVAGDGVLGALGLAAWLLMAAAYGPTLGLYGRPLTGALMLPAAAFLYTLMTVDSAVRHWRGQGGQWKGRVHPSM